MAPPAGAPSPPSGRSRVGSGSINPTAGSTPAAGPTARSPASRRPKPPSPRGTRATPPDDRIRRRVAGGFLFPAGAARGKFQGAFGGSPANTLWGMHMGQETRRSFNRKLLGSLTAFGLIETLF